MPNQSPGWIAKTALFLTSQMFSLFGSSLVGFAVIWHITLETSSASLMTVSLLCNCIPQIVVSPMAGVWADRYSRKALIILSDAVTALSTLFLAVAIIQGRGSLALIFVVTAVRSFGAGIQTPAVSAVLPQLVPAEKLMRVNGINASLNSVLLLLSPAAGGALLGLFGLGPTLLVDCVTAAAAIFIMLFLVVPRLDLPKERSSPLAELREGLRYIWSHPQLRLLLLFYGGFFFLATPAAVLTPIMIERTFGREVWRLTANELLWSAGSLLGGVIISVWGGYKNRIHTMALSCFGFGLTFALLGVVPYFWLYLAVIFVAGMFMPLFSTAETSLIQETVPQDMLGRVFSIVQIMAVAAMPLAMLLFGPLGDVIPIQWILVASGLMTVGLVPMLLRGAGRGPSA